MTPLEERIKSAKATVQECRAVVAVNEAAASTRLEANVSASADLRREYRWYGPVNLAQVADCIETLDRWSYRDPGQPITVMFNTMGGDVTAGFALFDFLYKLRGRGHHLTTGCAGLAASMGAILLQAGQVRQIDPRAVVLVHELQTGMQGRSTELEIEMEFIKKLQQQALDILAERATVTRATIAKKWKKGDWWLTADEVIRYGLADTLG